MPAQTHLKLTGPAPSDLLAAKGLDHAIRQRLNDCAYRFCFNQISWTLDENRLVLRGRVPSFYLKQVLQTLLRDLTCVAQIDNRVDVVSSSGLSSSAQD